MTRLPCKLWFCRYVPIELLAGWEGRSKNLQKENKQPWFLKLVESIKNDGLASPLLVVNGHDGSIERQYPMRVACGQNRLLALRTLGWKYIPCLVTHNLPEGVHGLELSSREEGQSYLRDGFLCILHQGLRVNQVKCPESMIYPKTADPYWPEEPNG